MAVETNFSALCVCSSEAHALPKTVVQACELTVEPCSGASKVPRGLARLMTVLTV